MGSIANAAAMKAFAVANGGQSGTIPMVKAYHEKEAQKEIKAKAHGFKNGIRDDEDDWLSRQLKEEQEAYLRMIEMFGLKKNMSDAAALKHEHEVAHAKARRKNTRGRS